MIIEFMNQTIPLENHLKSLKLRLLFKKSFFSSLNYFIIFLSFIIPSLKKYIELAYLGLNYLSTHMSVTYCNRCNNSPKSVFPKSYCMNNINNSWHLKNIFKHSSKCLACINSFNSHNNSMRQVPLYLDFLVWKLGNKD